MTYEYMHVLEIEEKKKINHFNIKRFLIFS